MKKKKERTLLSFWLKTCSGGGEPNSRERKSNFLLDFLVFGPSNFVGVKSKVVLGGKGYTWEPVLWSFDNYER